MLETNRGFSVEKLTERWEAQRAVKNQMGKYTWSVLLKRERRMQEDFWSRREDISLGVNNGWYVGREAVASYYEAQAQFVELRTDLLEKELPERFEALDEEEKYGAGSLDDRPIASELVEVAEDGLSAKGLWSIQGTYDKMTPAGLVAYWVWGYYAADFVLEDGRWRILHLRYEEDINHPCGEKWWEPVKPREPLEAYKAIEDFRFPAPTVPAVLRELYRADRTGNLPLRMPEPYRTLSETFSYGYEEGGE